VPVHDWTRVDAGLFHAFHQTWIISLCNALNAGGLPSDFYALPEQSVKGPIPDVLTLRLSDGGTVPTSSAPGLVTAVAPPRVRFTKDLEKRMYARKADRVSVRHQHGQVVAVIGLVSPGNKSSEHALRAFVKKSWDLIDEGVHLLVVDLFPPSKRDPQGLYKAIWEDEGDDFALPADKPLLSVSYDAGQSRAYVGPFAVGDALPEMPLFLDAGYYVPAPLEDTYKTTWGVFPAPLKPLLEAPAIGQ
jgi:hypothetical protein